MADETTGAEAPDFTDPSGWAEAAEQVAAETQTTSEHPGWDSLAEAVQKDNATKVLVDPSVHERARNEAKNALLEAAEDDSPAPQRRQRRAPEPEPTGDDFSEFDQEVEEAVVAAQEKKPWKNIKNPQARARILEKERDRALDELAELKQMVQSIMPKADQEDGEAEIDPIADPAAAILKEIREAKEEILRLKQEREQERQVARAQSAVQQVDKRLNDEIAADPVFKGAFDHVTRVVMNTHLDNPQFGRTEQERRLNIMASLLRKELEWYEQGKDPVEEVYRQAMKFGFDPDDFAQRAGVRYGPDGRPIKAQQPATQKAATPVDKIRASRRKDTGTIANVMGKPPKRFNAREWAKMDDATARYELRKLQASGDLPGKITLKDIIPQDAIFDDGL